MVLDATSIDADAFFQDADQMGIPIACLNQLWSEEIVTVQDLEEIPDSDFETILFHQAELIPVPNAQVAPGQLSLPFLFHGLVSSKGVPVAL
eukprot:scaffold584_cov132-Cylindrotheca_fusiformis.AAC.18